MVNSRYRLVPIQEFRERTICNNFIIYGETFFKKSVYGYLKVSRFNFFPFIFMHLIVETRKDSPLLRFANDPNTLTCTKLTICNYPSFAVKMPSVANQ